MNDRFQNVMLDMTNHSLKKLTKYKIYTCNNKMHVVLLLRETHVCFILHTRSNLRVGTTETKHTTQTSIR